MSASAADNRKPPAIVTRPALIGAACLLAIVLGLAWLEPARSSGPALAPRLEQRLLRFEDREDGAVIVRDAATGATIDVVVGQQGFLRQTMRGLAVVREAAGYGQEQPFELDYYADRRLILRDPATARQIELEAFGPTNEAVFARYLTANIGLATATSSGATVR